MRVVLVVALALAVAACKRSEAPAPAAPAAPAVAGAPGAAPAMPEPIKGKVLEKLEAEPYSYLKLATASGEVWAAVYKTDAAKGTDVVVEGPLPMKGFESKALNRKFDVVYFGTLQGQTAAPAARAGGPAGAPPGAMPPAGAAPPPGMPPGGMPPGGMPPGGMPPGGMGAGGMPPNIGAQHAAAAAGPSEVGDVKVEKAKGDNAKTVAEVYAQKAQLKDKKVTLRGKVVKYNAGIMGKNWLHVRDGSGAQGKGDNDVTVTTSGGEWQVGDVVTVVGVVRTDKDFGAGYAYPVIIEEATLTKK
jgi:hypothetical protein